MIMVSRVLMSISNGNLVIFKLILFFVIIALMISYQLIPQRQQSAILNALLFMFFTFILLNADEKDNLKLILKCLNKTSEESGILKGILKGLVSRVMPIIYVISLLVLYS